MFQYSPDVLIAGETIHDVEPNALDSLMAEWARTDIGYATRVGITGGLSRALMDARVKAVVIAGGGDAFSGGSDSKDVEQKLADALGYSVKRYLIASARPKAVA